MTTLNDASSQARPLHPLRTVLVGTSLGEESDQVVRAGLGVARAAKARVYLVYASPIEPMPVGFDVGAVPALEQERIEKCTEELRRQVERLGLGEPELAGFNVLLGAPHRVLTDTAEELEADLIVIGATESGPFAAELLGSTADRVVRKAPCPVLVVRDGLPVPPRRVLAPVDLSDLSGDAFRCGLHLLAQIAAPQDVQIQALYALSFMDALAIRQQAGGVPLEQTEPLAIEALQRFVQEHRPEMPFPVETAVVSGEAREVILQALGERSADLLILGTHGRGGWDRLILGSVASTVTRKAPCSVLLISPEAAQAEGGTGNGG